MKENTTNTDEVSVSISPNDHLNGHGLGEKIEIPPIILIYKERLNDLERLLWSLDDKKSLNKKEIKAFQKKMFVCLANIFHGQANPNDLNLAPILEQRREIAHIWGIEDVKSYRADLTDDQAWEILKEFYDRFDNETGLNDTLLQEVISGLSPEENEE